MRDRKILMSWQLFFVSKSPKLDTRKPKGCCDIRRVLPDFENVYIINQTRQNIDSKRLELSYPLLGNDLNYSPCGRKPAAINTSLRRCLLANSLMFRPIFLLMLLPAVSHRLTASTAQRLPHLPTKPTRQYLKALLRTIRSQFASLLSQLHHHNLNFLSHLHLTLSLLTSRTCNNIYKSIVNKMKPRHGSHKDFPSR